MKLLVQIEPESQNHVEECGELRISLIRALTRMGFAVNIDGTAPTWRTLSAHGQPSDEKVRDAIL